LERLHGILADAERASECRIQPIGGPGGIGKTEIALAYAHRHVEQFDAVFWINASSTQELWADYETIADQLGLGSETDPKMPLSTRRWLQDNRCRPWLLIFDGADERDVLDAVVDLLPDEFGNGRVLVTSRVEVAGLEGFASALEVGPVPISESRAFLLTRSGRRLGEEEAAVEALAHELNGTPLALEQAAAWVLNQDESFASYLSEYRQAHPAIQERYGPMSKPSAQAAATTCHLNLQRVEAESPSSAKLLQLSAFLGSSAIPFELLTSGRSELGAEFAWPSEGDELQGLGELLQPLERLSLVKIDHEQQKYRVHHLVQQVTQHQFSEVLNSEWADCAVRVLNAAIPKLDVDNFKYCKALAPHTLVVGEWIERRSLNTEISAQLLSAAAHNFVELGQPTIAEPLFEQTLRIRRRLQGEQHPDVAHALEKLGELHTFTRRYQEAESLYQRALRILHQTLGEQHLDFARGQVYLAGVYGHTGRYEEAEALWIQALQTCREILGEEHPDLADWFHDFGLFYWQADRYERAEAMFEQALQTRRRAQGEEHADLCRTLNCLSTLYGGTHRFDEAEGVLDQSQRLVRRTLGEQHPDFAESLELKAALCSATDRHQQAESLLQQALRIRREVFGVESPHSASGLNRLATLYSAMDRVEEAELLWQQVLDLPGEHSIELNNLAFLYVATGQRERAEKCFHKAIEVQRRMLGEQHPSFATSLYNLARYFDSIGRRDEATPMYPQVTEIYYATLGPDHNETREVQRYLKWRRRIPGCCLGMLICIVAILGVAICAGVATLLR
jgi:tetratricopeptide (TPR) repeat protein